VIKSVGFQKSKADYSLITRQNNSSFTTLLIYVDDILLTENDLTEMQHLKDCLLRQFHIKDLGDLKYFIGIEFSHLEAGMLVFTCHKENMCLIFCRIRDSQVFVQKNFL